MRRTTVSRILIAGVAGVAMFTLVGCGYPGAGPRYGGFAGNPTPRTDSLAYWAVERNNQHVYTAETNGRAFWDDVDRLILRDRPSRLMRLPNAY